MPYAGKADFSQARRLSPGKGRRPAVASLLCLLLLAVPGRGRAGPDGGLPGSFTRQGVGARALGMAGCFGALADDAGAVYWNPAGLALLVKPELTLNHISLFMDTSNDFAGYGLPLKRFGALGAGYLRQTSGDFEKRETPFDTPVTFGITNTLLQLGWAVKIPAAYTSRLLRGQLALGLGVKSVSQRIDTESGSGAGADAALLYLRENGFSLGAAVQNLLPPSFSLVSGRVSFPRVLDISSAYTRRLGGDLKGTLAARTNYFDGRLHPAAGSEFWYLDRFAARAGIEARGVTLGAGVRLYNYQVDYAVLLHELAASHTFSLSLKFGMTGPERAEEIKRGLKRLDQEEARRLARTYYLEGLELAKGGGLTPAIANLEKSDLLDPGNKQVERKLEELKAELAVQLRRQLAETSALLARQQYEQGNILISLEYWKTALQVDPANEEAAQAIATINSRLGSEEAATLAKAQRDMLDVQVSQFLAKARGWREQGHLTEAVAEARKALAADAGNEHVKTFLGELAAGLQEKVEQLSRQAAREEEKKDFKAAVVSYQAVLKLSPAEPGINEKLRSARAAVAVKVTPAMKKEAERLYYAAVDQYIKKKYGEAATTLARIFELDPGNEGGLKLKAKVEAALK